MRLVPEAHIQPMGGSTSGTQQDLPVRMVNIGPINLKINLDVLRIT